MKLSIVATLYQSENYLAEFHRRASAAASPRRADISSQLSSNSGPVPQRAINMQSAAPLTPNEQVISAQRSPAPADE